MWASSSRGSGEKKEFVIELWTEKRNFSLKITPSTPVFLCEQLSVNSCICSRGVIKLQCHFRSDFMGNDRQIVWVIKMLILFYWTFFLRRLLLHLLPCTAVSYCASNNKLEIGTARHIGEWPRPRTAVFAKARFDFWLRTSHCCNQIWPRDELHQVR